MMSGADSDEAAYVPSMMGLEGRILKHQHLWDCWETNSHNLNHTPTVPNTTNLLNHAFFAHTTAAPLPPPPTFLDCTAPPPLFPLSSSFPFYSEPQVAADCALGLNKSEDGVGGDRDRIGLNLGHRTYFSSADAFAIDRLFARSRGMYSLSHHKPPCCQAEGCKADLSGAKHYHRRHKVCEFHSKASVVVAAGLQQRFCQQCSRFHVLAEFDEAKRSCRKRLADHNRRRRKPQLPATTCESSSSKREQSSKPTEKCKQIQKVSRDRRNASTNKSTTTACTSTNISTSICLEGQQSYQNKGNQLRNVAALSLGGVGPVEQVGMGSASLYQRGQGSFVSISQGKTSQPKQQQQGNNTFSSAASNSTFFHHHTLFSSNEPSQTTEIGGGAGHCTSQHQSGLLHLGQVMFEVDSV